MSLWMWTIRNLISIARGTYNARKFWTHRTSGSVRRWTIAWKYAYKNLMLQSGSPTRSVVMNVWSSARDRSTRIEYWTLNSRNVNSMFAASGWFMLRRSHLNNTKFDQLCINYTVYKLIKNHHYIPSQYLQSYQNKTAQCHYSQHGTNIYSHHMQPTGTVLSPLCTWSHQGKPCSVWNTAKWWQYSAIQHMVPKVSLPKKQQHKTIAQNLKISNKYLAYN